MKYFSMFSGIGGFELGIQKATGGKWECERLQGFPDDWTVGSDTQRYIQCGNAVTVNVIEAITKELMKNV